MKRILLILILLHVCSTLFCQHTFFCGTDLLHRQALQNPASFQDQQELEKKAWTFFSRETQSPALQRGQAVVIPVVVHIIHNNGPENIPDAAVEQGIQWLNDAFANMNYYDQGSGTDVQIQFCLATRNPEGQPANGITRNQSTLTELDNALGQDLTLKNINRWNPKDYINIWVVKEICSPVDGCGISAYAYLPNFHGSVWDGIVIEASLIGSTQALGSALAHEMGHYFGLYHTFQGGCDNADCLADGDRVCDTPPDQSTASVPCSQVVNTCSTDTQSGFATDQPDMTRNFLDYGNNACLHDFTPGQAARMNFFLNEKRSSLLQSKGCLPPCPTTTAAAFLPGDTAVIVGQTLVFNNNSQNALAFHWTLNGVPFSSTPNAAWLFDSAGVFTVTLYADPANALLCEADSAHTVVQVYCPTQAAFTLSNLNPEKGSTVYVVNNSQNAASYEWFVDGVSQGATLDSLVFSAPGYYEIVLVALSGICNSKSSRLLRVRDSLCADKTFRLGYGTALDIPYWGMSTTTLLKDGNVLIAGASGRDFSAVSFSEMHMVLMKPDGNIIWSKSVVLDTMPGVILEYAFCNAVVGTPDGGFAVLWQVRPYFVSTNTFETRGMLIKFSGNGEPEWVKRLPSPVNDLTIEQDGNITVDALAKFDLNGNLIWTKNRPGYNVIKSAALPDGGLITLSENTSHHATIAHVDKNGNILWIKRLNTDVISFSFPPVVVDIAIGYDGNIYVLMNINTPLNISGAFLQTRILKMSPDGTLLWSKLYSRNNASWLMPEVIVSTPSGITIGGTARIITSPGISNLYDMFMHLDFEGKLLWWHHYDYSLPRINTLLALPGGGYFGTGADQLVGSNSWIIKADAFGNISDCPQVLWEIKSEDLPLPDVDTIVITEAPPLNFLPPDTFQVIDLPIVFDTLCTPECVKVEICQNNLDDDGDGLFDCLDQDCDCHEDPCMPWPVQKWYFGEHSGLDFSTEPPKVLTNGMTSAVTYVETSTICDSAGNLLFYTDGTSVFNRFHEVMPNGGLGALQPSSTLIVPHPGKKSRFYVFVLANQLRYWIVDMQLDGGKGDVAPGQQNPPIGQQICTGFAATRACAFDGWWLVAYGNEDGSAWGFQVFAIDQNGLNITPVNNLTGTNMPVGGRPIKISTDGGRIAIRMANIPDNSTMLFDFNTKTGSISPDFITLYPPDNLTSGVTVWQILGQEFSPGGRFLYATYYTGAVNSYTTIVQYDLEAGDSDAINASSTNIAKRTVPDNLFRELYLTPNGKICVTQEVTPPLGNPTTRLDVIHNPDAPGQACQFQYDALSLAPTPGVKYLMSHSIASYITKPRIIFPYDAPDTICLSGGPVAYRVKGVACGTDSVAWSLQGISGVVQANADSAFVTYMATGEGLLVAQAHTPCGIAADTLRVVVSEASQAVLDLGPDRAVCDNGVFTFHAGSGFAAYRWQDGAPDSIYTTLLPGTYWVDVWDVCGNKQSDTITVTVAAATTLDLGSDMAVCPDQAAFFQRPNFFDTWQWIPSDFLSCDTCISVAAAPMATTWWVVVAQTEDGCISVDSLTIVVHDTLFIQLDTSTCADLIVLFGATLKPDTTAQLFLPASGTGCDTLVTVQVTGFPPLAVDLPPDTTLRIGDNLVLNATVLGSGALSIIWMPAEGLSCTDCFDPAAAPLATTLYTLLVADANGCRAQDSIQVTVDPSCVIIIPNAFTPNGDGINDWFYPKTDPCVSMIRRWMVVNRWGDVVFERKNFEPNDPGLGWDGRWKGRDFPSDILIWYAELEYYDGQIAVKKGDVALLR